MDEQAVSFRTCHLCEATCGLEIRTHDDRVISVRGDVNHVFSHGYLCPKGVAIGELHHDPDRLNAPLIRDGGTWYKVTWDEAFGEIACRLPRLLEEHGRDSVAIYLGNPTAHSHAALFYLPVLVRALGTRYRFSASTVDQMPKQVSSGLMFGTEFSIAIPDIDHTGYFLLLGANPLVSNGSLMTAPDMPGRLRALRRRGGRLVVVDPRRTPTGDLADEYVAIRPGTDALFLAALAHELLATGLANPGDHARPWLAGLDVLPAALAVFTPETVESATSIPAETTGRIARELATAPTAAVYGRMGTTTTAFGTVASWLIDVINVLTGNFDRPGGVLFPLPPAGGPNTHGEVGRGRGVRVPGSRRTRVRRIAGVFGELPAAAIAEEIDTPSENGERLRALVTVAGNPVLSTPNGARLDAALKSLDFMVSIDPYLNETTRHAHVILPPPSPLTRSHFDILYSYFAVRNVASWSPPTFALAQGTPSEADLILRLAGIVMGGLAADTVDDLVAADVASRLSNDASSRVMGRDPAELIAAVSRRREDRILDLLLRAGPYGDGFGSYPGGLSIDLLEAAPHGIDLGPMRPRLPEMLRTPSGRVELAPPQLLKQLPALEKLLGQRADGLVLIGRRQLRSNNSWMHNLPLLAGGSNACTLHVHPQDAAAHALMDGGLAVVQSRVGELTTIVEVTDRVAPGVVSLPHGWGHDVPGTRLRVASQRPGVNINRLTDETLLDPLSGNAVLNGIPVTVTPAHVERTRAEVTRKTAAGQSASPAGKQVASRAKASAGSPRHDADANTADASAVSLQEDHAQNDPVPSHRGRAARRGRHGRTVAGKEDIMDFEHILVERSGDFATITMNRPQRRNALSLAHMRELITAFGQVGGSDAVGIVLAGRGPVFSAGHDFADVVDADLPEVRRLLATCTELMTLMQQVPQPVVARVHGLATAAGCQLVATADLAVASEDAGFAAPGGKGGWFCHTPMVAIARNIGRKRAMELAMSGDVIDARTALDWGLVNRVVPAAQLDSAVADLLERVTRGSAESKGLGKQALYAQIDLDQPKAYAYAVEVMAASSQRPDAREGIRAFLDKRKPNWRRGRG